MSKFIEEVPTEDFQSSSEFKLVCDVCMRENKINFQSSSEFKKKKKN